MARELLTESGSIFVQIGDENVHRVRALLDEGLAVSLAAYGTRRVTLVLAAYARLANAEGDLERAALLAGAVEGLRRRAGLAVWPAVRR